MTYNPNIPQPGDNPSQSQGQLLANFQQIQTQFGTNLSTGTGGDHVLLTSVSNNGQHNRVTLNNQAAAPDAVKQAGVNQLRFYGKTVSGVTMPYYTRDNIAIATTEWPLSPIKAYASFTTVATGIGVNTNIVPDDSFNINNPIVQSRPGSTTYTFTMTNACRTNVYGILFSLRIGSVQFITQPFYSITNSSVFVLNFPFTTNPNPVGKITVIVLET